MSQRETSEWPCPGRVRVEASSARRVLARWTAALLVTTAAACGGSGPTLPDDPDDGGGNGGGNGAIPTMVVDGLGAVHARYSGEVAVRGNTAYTTTWGRRGTTVGNVVNVWNVEGAVPELIDSLVVDGATTVGDVQISDDGTLLMVATEYAPGSVVLYSLADPRRPRPLSRFSAASTLPGVHTAKFGRVDGRLYAFLAVDPAPARLVVLDLRDPAAPEQVLEQVMGRPYVHDVFVRDGLLFTALWHDGLTIWDIGGGGSGGTPARPVQLGNVRTVGGFVHNVAWVHLPGAGVKRYAWVGEEVPGGVIGGSSAGDIHVVDVTDLARPREVAFYGVAGAGTHNFAVDEEAGVLYAAYYNAGIRALDVRGDLGNCAAEHRSADGRCDLARSSRVIATALGDHPGPVYVWGVALSGGRLYASDMWNGLWKLRPPIR